MGGQSREQALAIPVVGTNVWSGGENRFTEKVDKETGRFVLAEMPSLSYRYLELLEKETKGQ